MHQVWDDKQFIIGIKRLRIGYAIVSISMVLIIAWLAIFNFMLIWFYVAEHPNTLLILISALTIGLTSALYQAPGFMKLANASRRYVHGKAGIILLITTWALATTSMVTYYVGLLFPPPGLYTIPVPNPTLGWVSNITEYLGFLTFFPATILIAITLRRLGNDLRRPMVRTGVTLVLVGVSIIMFFGTMEILAPIWARFITSIETSIPIRVELPFELIETLGIIITALPPVLGLIGSVLFTLGLKPRHGGAI
ncbi:hypothetical protein [Vulcanisaeta sp. JCM 14467]